MRLKTTILLLLVFSTCYLRAQSPQAFSYQAVARDADGKVIASREVSLKVAFHQGVDNGVIVYEEQQKNLITNQFGLFFAQIGKGVPTSGTFSSIDWANGPLFLEIGIDPNNGNNFQLSSVTEILSVPYALYAEKTNENDGDPTNELQKITLSGNVLTLSNGGGAITLPNSGGGNYTAGLGVSIAGNLISNTGDIDPSNDITNTTLAGGDLTGIYPNPILAPNSVGSTEIIDGSITINDLAAGTVPQFLNDLADVNTTGVTNGQVLKWNGSSWVPSNDNTTGGTAVVLTSSPISGDGTNLSPITLGQNGATNGQVLKWNGSTWTPMNDIMGNTYVAGTGITIGGSTISALDPSVTNELQTLTFDSITHNLTISNGNAVQIAGFGASYWKKSGTNLEPVNAVDGVNIPSGNLTGGGATGWSLSKFSGSGFLSIKKSSGTGGNVSIGAVSGSPNNGAISIFNPNNIQSVYEHSCVHNAGEIWTQSPTGKINVDIGHNSNPEEGRLDILGSNFSAGSLASLFVNNGVGNINLSNQGGMLLMDANQSNLDPDGGALRIYSQNNAVARIYASNGNGELLLASQSGENVLTAGSGYSTTGDLSIWAPGNKTIGSLKGCIHSVGDISLYDKNENLVVSMGHTDAQHLENGFVGVFSKNGDPFTATAGFFADDSLGTMFSNNIEGNQFIFDNNTTGIWHTTVWEDDNGGVEMVRNKAFGTPKVILYVDDNDKGSISTDNIYATDAIVASVKNFRMDHPNDKTKEIYYASVEGPEAAAYERGTGQVVDGKVFIPFSETFSWIVNPNTLTIQLTVNSTDTYGLAVVEKNASGFWVKELKGGTGTFTFDWEAKGVRKGYENYKVVRDKTQQLPEPGIGKGRTMPQRTEEFQH